ncbi:unnamed protein product, partial [Urochloa humidicola]
FPGLPTSRRRRLARRRRRRWRGGILSPASVPCRPAIHTRAGLGRLVSPPAIDLHPLSLPTPTASAPHTQVHDGNSSHLLVVVPILMDPVAGGGGKQVGDPPPLTCRLISSSPPSCISPCQKKKSTPLAAVRRLPPESGGSQQGRRWIRRRHATWWWVRPRHAACWRVRPRRLDVPSAQRHWPCTRMANVRSQAKGRGLMVVFFVSPIFASVLFLALIFKRCVCSPSQLKHNLDLALSESIPYFLAHRIAFFEGSIAYSDFVFFPP